MEERKDNRLMAALILAVIVATVLWVLLIIFKAAGVVGMPWPLVLSGLVWISWSLLTLTTLAVLIVRIIIRLKLWHRRRKNDARIIAQAKAAGVWDKKPIVLGGRALELRAWQDFQIKREPGEPDANLRRRYMDRYDALIYALRAQICGAVQIPPEILYGGEKTDTKTKEEAQNE